MIAELFIENQRVDLSADISSLLTFAIDDIKNFSARNTTFSKTIVLPGTLRNNRIFGHVFELGSANPYDSEEANVWTNFNAAKSAQCYLFQDNMQVFKGVVRLLEIVVDKGRTEYEVAVFGELGGFISTLGTAKLEDLDFSAHDQVFNSANILASWDNPGGSGVYYPLIDYGTYSVDKHSWLINTFRPALYVKEYIDKIFEGAGYTYSCDLFNTGRFKRLIVPNNRKTLQRYSSQTFFVTAPTGNFDGDSNPLGFFAFTNHVLTTGFTPNGASTQWTNSESFDGVLSVNLRGSYTKSAAGTLRFNFLKNGVVMAYKSFGSSSTVGTFNFVINATSVSVGDVISVEFDGPPTYTMEVTADLYNTTGTPQLIELQPGDMIEINANLPKNILQKDFFASVLKLFNLYVFEDQFIERRLNITPFPDYYTGGVVDWTYKLNRNAPIKLKPLSELNSRYYNFKFKQDSDYYNEMYRKRYNKGYGDRIYDSEFEFAKETAPCEVIFSATPLVGFSGEDKVYPTIYKKSGSTEETVDSNIRILQTKKISGVSSWQILSDGGVYNTLDYYGYAGHLDDPTEPDNDLNFGAPEELFFELDGGDISRNQFNLYWSAYMAEITDKDSKLLTAKFYLTPKDIYTLDFAKYVLIDGVLFRLNKIVDYNASAPDECTVELLRVISTLYTYPEGSSNFFLLWNDTSPLLDSDTQEILYI